MKNSDFRVAPTGNATDTIIAYILGVLSGIFEILSIIKSIISKGSVERIYGVLMISAFLMSFTGFVFAVIGYHSEDGGVTSKKAAIYLNVVIFIIAGIFFLKGI